MKISLNWIKSYIPKLETHSEKSLELLKNKMISIGLDIESIENEGDLYKNFITGEVTEKQKHPDADKLSLCKVNIGEKVLSIVCGAQNVEAGQKVCVATIGAIIPNGNFEIKKSKIRGELSEGMICSEKELNLAETSDGIMILDKNTKPGINFADHINANDVIFEIGITPNRGDLFSHFGIAREIAALYNLKIKIPEIKLNETGEKTTDLINISIENNSHCKRFTGRVIKNVEIKESPEWLKKKLISIGLRPRNNIVDITNFVMFETGQPLHAFDYDKIHDKKIIVKNANEGDKFTTLDSKVRDLNAESLMVCDGNGYSGIAGIMGGETSEIKNDTKNVFLESAYFDPVSVRKNSKKLGLQTDASQRFERGVDIEMVEYASLRASQLINELAGGEISTGFYDFYTEKNEKLIVGIRSEKACSVIGIELSDDMIIEILGKIDINFIKKEKEYLEFEIPEFRRLDLQREIDLIEEVTRIYGYDNIDEDTNFSISTVNTRKYSNSNQKVLNIIDNHLTGRGFNEILTEPLVDENKIKFFSENPAKLLNSISAGMNVLRTNLSYGMMNVVRNNLNNSGKNISLKLFETGKVFSDEGGEFSEKSVLMIALSGKKDTELIYGGDKYFDIFDLKGEVEMLLSKLNLENYRLIYYNDKTFGGVKIDISLNNDVIGNINQADSELKREFDIDSEVYFAEFQLDKIYRKVSFSKYYKTVSKFPSVKRDLAIVVDRKITFEDIKNSVKKSGGNLLKKLELFDIYEGDKIAGDKKSVAFSLDFISDEKTLTDEETNNLTSKILSNLEKSFGAELRK